MLGEYVLLLLNCTFQSGDFTLAKLPGACFIFGAGVLSSTSSSDVSDYIVYSQNQSRYIRDIQAYAKSNEQELFRPTILIHATFAVNFPFLA